MTAPPSFLQVLPTETDATDGDIVTFQVKVSSDPDDPTVVSWWRCGESLRPIVGKREIISHDDGWHELILSNITEEDEGEYECRAENNRGHNSCFGSLYYYREGGGYTMTDVTMEELAVEGDGRQSGLLILIDDGSQTDECLSGDSNRKSMTISEQMQGIIEDLTHSSSQGERTGSMTLEKDDENQFYSDIEELCDDDLESNVIQDILGMSKKQGSEETLVPEMPSPDITADIAVSEGAPNPYAPTTVNQTQKWRSNPNNVSKNKREKEQAREKEGDGVWPPDATMVTFDLPLDTETTSVELPFAKEGSTEEEAHKSSLRCVGAETPFDVADITEEAVDGSSSKDAGSFRHSPTDGVTSENFGAESGTGVASQEVILATKLATDSCVAPRIDQDTSLTSVTEITGEAILLEGGQQSKMSFTRSSFKSSTYQYTDDTATSLRSSSVTSRMSSTTFGEESVSYHRSSRMTRTVGELDDDSLSLSTTAKRTKLSSAYEADESSLSMPSKAAIFSDAFQTEAPAEIKSIDVYVAIMDFKPMESDEEAVAMKEGQQVEIIDASKPRRWLVRTLPMKADETPKEGWVPACYLEKSTAYDTLSSYVVTEAELDPKELEAIQNREAIVKELVETEEDFAKDMQYVVDNYYKQMDNPRLPKEFRDRKGSVFGNFKDICDFHNNVLMKGVHYHAKEPTKLGKTFLRLERDFDMHASYCWNEARAQRLLKEGPLKEYFDDHSRMIDDDKLLNDHLKLPIQRLNDYQLLLKELIKYSSRLNEDTTDLQKALDFIHSINTRTKDLQLIQAIQGCQGDLLKIGRVIKHDTFDVIEGNEGRLEERYVFLFKGRVFVTEKQTVSGKEFYHVTNLFKLQDVEMIENIDTDPLKILFRSHKKNRPGFPLTFRARSLEQKATWTKELSAANQAVEDLGDLEPVPDRPQSFADIDGAEPEQKPEISLEPDLKKQKTETFKRQDSITKKSTDSSAPQTPTEETTALPLTRQDSIKKEPKSAESSVPSTPTDITSKPPRLSRQDSAKKKQKSAESSAPQTPTETSTNESPLARKDSIKKKSKSAEISEPSTPVEEKSIEPPFVREDLVKKKSESAESSELRTPAESSTEAPLLTRQDSVKKKPKRVSSITEKETEAVSLVSKESENTALTRQESLSKEEKISVSEKRKSEIETVEDNSTKTKVRRQDSLKKEVTEDSSETAEQSKEKTDFESKPAKTTEEKQIKGEDFKRIIPTIMSEDASGSDARLESIEFGEDNATLASESLRSDESSPASGAYEKPSLTISTSYCHMLFLIPVLCACYAVTQILGVMKWE